MTSPEGDTCRGWWRITSVGPAKAIEYTDALAPAADLPSSLRPGTTTKGVCRDRHR
jgi:hypothetical protein